jgi:hypothetical protein
MASRLTDRHSPGTPEQVCGILTNSIQPRLPLWAPTRWMQAQPLLYQLVTVPRDTDAMQGSGDPIAQAWRDASELDVVTRTDDPLRRGGDPATNSAGWTFPAYYGLMVMVAVSHPAHPSVL